MLADEALREVDMRLPGDGDNKSVLFHHVDGLKLVEAMVLDPSNSQGFMFKPEVMHNKHGQRVVGRSCQGAWWFHEQAQLPPGVFLFALMVSGDGTRGNLKRADGFHPLYAYCGNVPEHRRQTSEALALAGLIPILIRPNMAQDCSDEMFARRVRLLESSCLARFIRSCTLHGNQVTYTPQTREILAFAPPSPHAVRHAAATTQSVH